MFVSKFYKVFYSVWLFLSFFMVNGQHRPPIHNFNVHDYEAGIQNWGITYGDNNIYVANNEGLLEFDGIQWRFYELPNKTIVRSVAYIDKKIYTGSYEEFGYWEKTSTGQLKYYSLSEKIEAKNIETESIWGIYQYKDAIIFKSFSSLFIYRNGKIEVIKPGTTIMGANVANGHFYVFGREKGIYELVDFHLILLKETEALKNYKVQTVNAISSNEVLIGTSLNGCFIWDGKLLRPWNHPFNAISKQNQLNKITISKDFIFMGTIKNGVYVFNIKSQRYYNLNVQNGLQNNTVLGSVFNERGMLWLSLDNGVSAIPIHFNAYYLNPSKEDIGGVYDMVVYNGDTYIATNTGVYVSGDNGISFIDGSQGHIWDLTLVGDVIVCGHNLGTYQIKNKKWESISPQNGGYVFREIKGRPDTYVQGNYSGLTLYTKRDNSWEAINIEGIDFPVKRLVFEKDHIAWVAHAYKGVFRIHFSEDYKKITKIEKQYTKDFANSYMIKLFKIEGQIAFYNEKEWLVYNPLEEKIVPFESLNTILGKDKDAYPITDQDIEPIVFKKSDGTLFVREDLNSRDSQFYLPLRYYNNRLLKNDEKAIVVNDSLIQIALYNDILAINPQKITAGSAPFKPKINRILKNGTPQPLDTVFSLKQRDTIIVETSVPFLSNNTIVYSLSDDVETDYRKVPNGKIMLTNLPFGETKLNINSMVKAKISNLGVSIPIQTKKPWYMGVWGIILLMVILAALTFFVVTINKYMLIRHKKYLEDQFEHEKELNRKEEALRHEKKLNELQKKQHDLELKGKTKELANTALEMTKKNEILMKLKDELLYFKSEIIDKVRYNKLLKSVDRNINNANDWEIFESNFNEIHDSFFKNLLKKHPDVLTSKDLKLCAYLKMNLSSKEIAPLMSISVRGVEIHRYRLRKKLELSSEQNINEYLMNV
ncbi:helix-turn-helix and ligand-binding sensor domain-containing protein [Galbibacter pacificus]|uniref:LuxR C-terminal-related transcriptional regulator n=1 Tax=Galbibacter pacificus TaxID=2996052 RepID=A0ABT6FP01_9FLAO|nr:LuxR C-terminal-related transcriptional regulator [Galbibacter pacificus]MDG3581519.1 LuxR C-terminal-related transcriptional regulator [Galbibacter pacificus]MDG3584997.1 LuxR C-terminal-related transcriptional regulator [Galbibacter pacificus]